MKKDGFFGIGCYAMKTAVNYGSLFRSAQLFNADFIFLIGQRFKKTPSDTAKAWRHIPTYSYETFADFQKHRPYSCPLIGVELTDKARPIGEFSHPKTAIYLLGAEDNGLTNEAMNACEEIIYLPGERSMNVACAGSIVMYDRYYKACLHRLEKPYSPCFNVSKT